MKKKGLIVATIVMVVVLAASLTTATYAWFTVTNVTSIDSFAITVSAGNAVNIGVKTNNTHAETVTADDFKTGEVTYEKGPDGTLGGGKWEGADGLGATLTHDIVWGTQSAAVGATATANQPTTPSSYGTIADIANANSTFYVNAANSSADAANTLTTVTAAAANKGGNRYAGGTESGDYAYIFLGASPAKTLLTNELIILINGSNSPGTIVGMLSAIHVAYRVTKSGAGAVTTEWTEVDVFGEDYHYDTLLSGVTCDLSTAEQATYQETYGTAAPTTSAYAYRIDGLSIDQNEIDQIELVIYIAGTDSDCRDEAKGAGGSIQIFFHTTEAASA